MSTPFIDRPPMPREIERLRLILSTYQDGGGMVMQKDGTTVPGWRDFERSVALAFGGDAQESKHIFDVLFPASEARILFYGLSCKMRRELNKVDKQGRVTMELSNSAGKFWDQLRTKGIDQSNYKQKPAVVGAALIELVELWHLKVSVQSGGNIDLRSSFYLALSWSKSGWYQLFQFPLKLPNPDKLKWSYPDMQRRLVGKDRSGIEFEWYGESGGQLKYYPRQETAIWRSERFRLEPLLIGIGQGILAKASQYFPAAWKATSDE